MSVPAVAIAVIVGTVVATPAPLLLIRRIRRTDIPGMLRIVE